AVPEPAAAGDRRRGRRPRRLALGRRCCRGRSPLRGVARVISIEQVSKRFGSHAAVDDVSLEIEEGEFFSLLGPSGCGKTTTLRMIAGFEAPDAGRIVLAGRDVTNVPANKRPVNMVFQQYAL